MLNELRASTQEFVEINIKPYAGQIDKDGEIIPEVLNAMRKEGYFGINASSQYHGKECTYTEIAVINEEFGKGCSSIRAILTVHGMVVMALEKWASEECKNKYLRDLATGEKIASFCLTEPEAGSDSNSITSSVTSTEQGFILNGRKKWITMGQIADVFLVFAKMGNGAVALLVDKKETPGIHISPISDINGMRGGYLAEIIFENCMIPQKNLIGGIGLGLQQVSLASLLYGRFTIACGCVGVAQECLDIATRYAKKRRQFGEKLYKHQLIKKLIAEMVVDVFAARSVCMKVAEALDNNSQDAGTEAFIAKYFCSKMVTRVINNAIQVQGANGLVYGETVERFYRDMRIVEIIEGTSQIHEIIIANSEIIKRK